MASEGMSASRLSHPVRQHHIRQGPRFVQVRPCSPGVLPIPEPQRTPPHLMFLVFQDLTFEEDWPGLENVL